MKTQSAEILNSVEENSEGTKMKATPKIGKCIWRFAKRKVFSGIRQNIEKYLCLKLLEC